MGSLFKTPKAPPPPDPYATAQAQTASNLSTAIAQSYIGNANEKGPLGGVSYKVGGYKIVDGKKVPQFTRTQTLSPNQQKLLTGQERLGVQMNDIAKRQLSSLSSTLAKPVDLKGLPARGQLGAPPTLSELSGRDYSEDRKRVEQAMFDRMRPEMDRARSGAEARLAAQGITLGSEAYRAGQDDLSRSENDARLGIVLAGGQEQSRLLNEERQSVGFNNNTRTGMYNMARSKAEFDETARERALQERLIPRNQAINEIGALSSGGQVSMPQFTPYRGGEVAPTPVGQYVYQSAGLAQDAYNTKTQAQATERAGLYNLAGDVAGGWMRYGRR